MTLAAAGIGVSYYVPAGMFAVSFGGSDAGTVSAYLDAVSFGMSGLFLMGLKYVIDGTGWWAAWLLLGALALVGTVLMARFCSMLLVEPRHGSGCGGERQGRQGQRYGEYQTVPTVAVDTIDGTKGEA